MTPSTFTFNLSPKIVNLPSHKIFGSVSISPSTHPSSQPRPPSPVFCSPTLPSQPGFSLPNLSTLMLAGELSEWEIKSCHHFYLKTHEHSSSSFGCTPFSVDYKVIYHAINTVFPLCSPVIVLWILSLSSIKHFVTQIILLLNWCCFRCLGYTFSLLFPDSLADSHPDRQTWAHPLGSSDYKLSIFSPGSASY